VSGVVECVEESCKSGASYGYVGGGGPGFTGATDTVGNSE